MGKKKTAAAAAEDKAKIKTKAKIKKKKKTTIETSDADRKTETNTEHSPSTFRDWFMAHVVDVYSDDLAAMQVEQAGDALGWIGLDWIGLDWIGLDWIGLSCLVLSRLVLPCLDLSCLVSPLSLSPLPPQGEIVDPASGAAPQRRAASVRLPVLLDAIEAGVELFDQEEQQLLLLSKHQGARQD